MIVSIDPGQTGAIAVIQKDTKKILTVADMPVTVRTSGKGNEVNAYLLAKMFYIIDKNYGKISTIIIERVHAMPGQGSTSMFNFGRSLGVIEGLIGALGLPVIWVTPQKWKKKMGLIKKDKDAARSLIISQYPDNIEWFKRKKDCGRADAVLIGLSTLD